MVMKEEWRPVVGYEDLYEVSNTGQVRSLDKYDSLGVFWIGKLLSKLKVRGYFMVKLRKDGIQKMCSVHRLVAQAFIPNPLGLPQINHKDEVKTNNRVENLEWCTAKYNNNYGTKNKRMIDTKIKKGYVNEENLGLGKKEYKKRWNKSNKSHIRNYHKKWLEEHPGYHKKWLEEHPGYMDRYKKIKKES